MRQTRTSKKRARKNLQQDFGEWGLKFLLCSLCLDLAATLGDRSSFFHDEIAVVLAALVARKVVLVSRGGLFEPHLGGIVRHRRGLKFELGVLGAAQRETE